MLRPLTCGTAIAVSNNAVSRTVGAIGPAVSCVWLMGTMPSPAMSPTVGLSPTMPATEAGHVTEPSVSVPTASGAKCATIAAPDPELEPHAVRVGSSGFTARPPTALQPLLDQL